MPFAPFWPSASIHYFLIQSKISLAWHCCACLLKYSMIHIPIFKQMHMPDMHVHNSSTWLWHVLTWSLRLWFFLIFLLCSCTYFLIFTNAVNLWKHLHAHTDTATEQLYHSGLLQLVLQKVCQIYKWSEQAKMIPYRVSVFSHIYIYCMWNSLS